MSRICRNWRKISHFCLHSDVIISCFNQKYPAQRNKTLPWNHIFWRPLHRSLYSQHLTWILDDPKLVTLLGVEFRQKKHVYGSFCCFCKIETTDKGLQFTEQVASHPQRVTFRIFLCKSRLLLYKTKNYRNRTVGNSCFCMLLRQHRGIAGKLESIRVRENRFYCLILLSES